MPRTRLCGRLALELFADFADERRDRFGVLCFRLAQTLGRYPRGVGGERREAALGRVRDDPGELEQLFRHLRIERRLLDLHAPALRGFRPPSAETLEELVH